MLRSRVKYIMFEDKNSILFKDRLKSDHFEIRRSQNRFNCIDSRLIRSSYANTVNISSLLKTAYYAFHTQGNQKDIRYRTLNDSVHKQRHKPLTTRILARSIKLRKAHHKTDRFRITRSLMWDFVYLRRSYFRFIYAEIRSVIDWCVFVVLHQNCRIHTCHSTLPFIV